MANKLLKIKVTGKRKKRRKAPLSILSGAKLLGSGIEEARLIKARHFPKRAKKVFQI